MIAAHPPVFWWRAFRRGVAFWIGVRGLFYLVAVTTRTTVSPTGYQPSAFGSLITALVVGVLCTVQIVAMRERVFLANAGIDRLAVLAPMLAVVPLEIVLALAART